jgi:spore coat-associated protein N
MESVSLVNGLLTDSASVPANSFVSGTVDLSGSPTTAVVSATGMVPGNTVTAPMTVTNSGSLALRYAVTSTINNTAGSISLAAQLKLRIRSGVSSCVTASFDADAGGVNEYGGAGGADLGSVGGTNLIGDPTAGNQTGDRSLAAGASEVLCVQVALPSSTSSTYSGLSSTATFSFAAEQTRNNP